MKGTPFPICECTDVVYLGSPLVGSLGIKSQAFRWSGSDCFSIEAARSKAWPAPSLYHPPSHLLNDGSLCWSKGSSQEAGHFMAPGSISSRKTRCRRAGLPPQRPAPGTPGMVRLIALKTQALLRLGQPRHRSGRGASLQMRS